MTRLSVFSAALFIFTFSTSFSQEIVEIEIQQLIDQPTAGSLEKGEYGFDVRLFPGGGALSSLRAGLFDRFMIGISYGGVNIIGRGRPDWNQLPGVLIKYRLFEETDLPAVSIGFDSQGYGAWADERERNEIKAKGIYAVASKNFSMGW